MRMLLVFLFGVSSMLAARTAAADCGYRTAMFSPVPDTPLPPQGTAYLFAPRWTDPYASEISNRQPAAIPEEILQELVVEGARYHAHAIATSPSEIVVRIDYVAEAPQLTLRWGERAFTYPIASSSSSSSSSSEKNVACVTDVEHQKAEWSCSPPNEIVIGLRGNAIAYRLAWSDGTTTITRGMPLWDPEQERPKPFTSAFTFGDLGCAGENVDLDALAHQRSFRLSALFADGSEQVFPVAATTWLADEHALLPVQLQGTCSAEDPSDATLEPGGPASLLTKVRGAHLLSALGALACLFALLVGVRLLRHPRDRVVRL
jgi:hypothetical protein